jgi:hypothetical protein
MYGWMTESQYMESLKRQWEQHQRDRGRERAYMREVRGNTGFLKYVEAVKQRLACHGFTQPFRLEADPGRQTKLATWVEYLNFEYWWLDKHALRIKLLRPKRDETWERLVGSGVLRPGENPGSLRSHESAVELSEEHDRAKQAVTSARGDS